VTEIPAPAAPPLDQLATALAAFQGEMPTVPKAHTATVKSDKGSYSYTYAGLADVAEAAMPLLSKHGLSFVTLPGPGTLTGILLHASGQSLTATLPIAGNSPQQIGSSLTYMRRYLLGCMTGLVTDDDDDGRQAQAASRRKPAEKRAERLPGTPDNDPYYTAPPADTGELMSARTRGQMFALFGQKGVAEAEQLPGINHICGTSYGSRAEITEADARKVIGVLKKRPDATPTAEEAAKP